MLYRSWQSLTILLATAVLCLAPDVAEAQTRVPPSDPPPNCEVGGRGDSCPSGMRWDHYDPANCPRVLEERPPIEDAPPDILCSSPERAPIPAIACWDYGSGRFACEGEPLSAPGALTYSWTVNSALKIEQMTGSPDPSTVQVKCKRLAAYASPVLGYVTLTVKVAGGASATKTQALPCAS